MNTIETSLKILTDSLKKKYASLQELKKFTDMQYKMICRGDIGLSFNEISEQKDKLINKVKELDEGFELIYGRISKDLLANSKEYREHIILIQSLIKNLMEMSMRIEVMEKTNYDLLSRKQISKVTKVPSTVASIYKKNDNQFKR